MTDKEILSSMSALLYSKITVKTRHVDGDFDPVDPFCTIVTSRIEASVDHSDEELIQSLEKASQYIANYVNNFQILETYPFAKVHGVVTEDRKGLLPIRVSLFVKYNGGIDIEISLKARNAGNYYREIVNGPLHGAMMPFQKDPLHRQYVHYYGFKHPEKEYKKDVRAEFKNPNVVQSYEVIGKYCYYHSERMLGVPYVS